MQQKPALRRVFGLQVGAGVGYQHPAVLGVLVPF